jgi:hypothetical protein
MNKDCLSTIFAAKNLAIVKFPEEISERRIFSSQFAAQLRARGIKCPSCAAEDAIGWPLAQSICDAEDCHHGGGLFCWPAGRIIMKISNFLQNGIFQVFFGIFRNIKSISIKL